MRIKLKNLCKCFCDNVPVLDNINFDEDINTLAVIGSSGGGKSTLLKILRGIIKQTSGEIFIDNEPADFREASAYLKSIGFVFQQGGLFKHISAKDNITLPLIKVHGLTKEEADMRADELLNRFGLEHEAHKKPAGLSVGQQQRIAIARAVAPKPKLLLLDEPTSALDPEYTTEVLNIITELKSDGIRFIIATHEMGFARHACESTAFLHDGKILEYGTSDNLFKSPQTPHLQKFLGKLLKWNI